MIQVFNFETAHLCGNVLPTLLRLRHREFVERLEYKVPTYNGMEYDQYDTPAAVYMVWRDDQGEIRAGTRISPTNRPYMIKDLWPNTVQFSALPSSPHIWEATRLFIDKDLSKEQHKQAHSEILCAYLEFALHYGIKNYIGTAPPGLWKYTFLKAGWPVEFLGNATVIDYAEKIITGLMPVTDAIYCQVREQSNISYQVLSDIYIPMEFAA
jgi:N-acyl-L-homoserine lactone synthetase